MKMKRSICLSLLIALLCLSLFPTSVQASTNSGETDDLKLYISAIEETISIDPYKSTGMLYDLDADGFDELIAI